MIIKKCELEKIIGLNSKIPNTNKKEFVLVGRSNVGKSSFINTFINRKNYARTSSTPGKTRTINYYNVNDKFYFVDLPGYGYAKVSESEQKNWSNFINKYLQTSRDIEEIIMFIDIRHKPSDKDVSMWQWIFEVTGYEPIVVATKVDKIKKTEVDKNKKMIRDELLATDDSLIIPFSATTREGLKKINEIIEKIVE